jgi:hypothetical protein
MRIRSGSSSTTPSSRSVNAAAATAMSNARET